METPNEKQEESVWDLETRTYRDGVNSLNQEELFKLMDNHLPSFGLNIFARDGKHPAFESPEDQKKLSEKVYEHYKDYEDIRHAMTSNKFSFEDMMTVVQNLKIDNERKADFMMNIAKVFKEMEGSK